jgi:hypothetical protein
VDTFINAGRQFQFRHFVSCNLKRMTATVSQYTFEIGCCISMADSQTIPLADAFG